MGRRTIVSFILQDDPFGTVKFLSEEERMSISYQRIPTLQEFTSFARKMNKTVLFDLQQPPEDHPYHESFVNVTLDVILESGLAESQVRTSQSKLTLYSSYKRYKTGIPKIII